MANMMKQTAYIFVLIFIQTAAMVILEDEPAEIPTNMQEDPPGKRGPCLQTMSNGMPCVKDLLGFPIDIYREDWSSKDREVFWNTQFLDTGKVETVPTFPNTGLGFKKMNMPDEMLQQILDYYHSLPDKLETHVPGFINNQPKKREEREKKELASGTGKMGMAEAVTYLREFTGPERDMILTYMTKILEEWVGGAKRPIKLEYTSIYGMRIYTNGSMLMNHCDKVDTHAVSAILNIAQEGIREPWPLVIMGNDGRTHEVIMKPGEMVLYESARLAHGRPYAFNGDRYCNAFVHLRPGLSDYSRWMEGANSMKKLHASYTITRKENHKEYQQLLRAERDAIEREEREEDL